MPLSAHDDLELLRLAIRDLGSRAYRPPGGTPALAGRIVDTRSPGQFCSVQPLIVGGPEAQNATATLTDDGDPIPVYPLNGGYPGIGVGERVIARAVGWRWAMRGVPIRPNCSLLVSVWGCCFVKAPGVSVHVTGPGGYDETQDTDANGFTTFDLTGYGAGTYDVTVLGETRSVVVACRSDFVIFGSPGLPDVLHATDGAATITLTKGFVGTDGSILYNGCRTATATGYDTCSPDPYADPLWYPWNHAPPVGAIAFPVFYTLKLCAPGPYGVKQAIMSIGWGVGPDDWNIHAPYDLDNPGPHTFTTPISCCPVFPRFGYHGPLPATPMVFSCATGGTCNFGFGGTTDRLYPPILQAGGSETIPMGVECGPVDLSFTLPASPDGGGGGTTVTP
jgi:hypothetical protein